MRLAQIAHRTTDVATKEQYVLKRKISSCKKVNKNNKTWRRRIIMDKIINIILEIEKVKTN